MLNLRAIAGMLAAVLLAGCGFHLAGERPLPKGLSNVYIDFVDPYRVAEPPVETALQKRIEQRGGAVKSKIEEADTVIRLSDLQERQEVLAIGPDGKAIEYRLITSVRYEVDAGKAAVIAPDIMVVSRDYSFSAQQILAKEVEQSRLRDYIQGEMADLLLLRTESVMNHQAALPPVKVTEPAEPVPPPAADSATVPDTAAPPAVTPP